MSVGELLEEAWQEYKRGELYLRQEKIEEASNSFWKACALALEAYGKVKEVEVEQEEEYWKVLDMLVLDFGDDALIDFFLSIDVVHRGFSEEPTPEMVQECGDKAKRLILAVEYIVKNL